MLDVIAEEVWGADGEVRFWGQRLHTRMTVLRLRDAGLWLHSPVALDDGLRAEIDALGPVRWIVAPSKYHHVHIGPWREAYPGARLYGAPGLAAKRRDLAFDVELSDAAPPEWRGELELLVFWPLPMFNEVEFLHRPSRTLVVTDLVFNVQEATSARQRALFRLNGMWRRFGPSRGIRMMMRDRAGARALLARLLEWEFDRVIPTHGAVVERGGRESLRQAFAFLERA